MCGARSRSRLTTCSDSREESMRTIIELILIFVLLVGAIIWIVLYFFLIEGWLQRLLGFIFSMTIGGTMAHFGNPFRYRYVYKSGSGRVLDRAVSASSFSEWILW